MIKCSYDRGMYVHNSMVSATPVIVSFICFSLHSSKISKRLPLIFFFGRDVVLSLHLCFKSRQALNDKYSLSRACLHAASVQNQNDVPFLEINKKNKKKNIEIYWERESYLRIPRANFYKKLWNYHLQISVWFVWRNRVCICVRVCVCD